MKSGWSRRLLRTSQAAEYLGVSVWTLRKLIQSGGLPVVQHSETGKFLLDVRDLEGFIERNKKTGPI